MSNGHVIARSLREGSLDAFVACDADLCLRYADDPAQSLFGKPSAELLGLRIVDILPSSAADGFMANCREALASGTPALFEYKFPGESFSRLVKTHPMPGGGLAICFRDTTERSRTETALELAVRTHQIGTFEWTIPTGHVVWSETEERLFGVAPGTFGGDISNWSERVQPDDLGRLREEFDACWRDRCEDISFQYRICWPDGAVRYLEGSGRFLYSASGQPLRMVGVNIDVTERMLADRTLAAQAQELARSNEELERFAYTASHDLQEPIRTVVTFTQLLARQHTGKLSKDANEYISLILEASNRMSKLIASLLEYSRVSTHANPERAAIDMNRVLQTVLRLMSFSVTDSGAEITHDVLPAVAGNEEQLIQLLQNLVANAIKYRSPQEPPRLHLSAETRPTGECLFSLADNGIGFDQKYAETIFGVFKRLHGSRYAGTGIGLAIARKIVERHGGRIWATSQGGKGSVFFFTLPAAAGPV